MQGPFDSIHLICINAVLFLYVFELNGLIYNPIALDVEEEAADPSSRSGPLILRNDKSEICALLFLDGVIDIAFDRKDGSIGTTKVRIPHKGSVSGLCDNNYIAKYVTVSWRTFTMSFYFGLDEEDEQWFLRTITITYNMSDPAFKGKGAGGRVELDTSFGYQPILKARLDRAFTCPHFGEVPLENKYREAVATLFLNNVTLQPFGNGGEFAPGQMCLRSRHPRDETVPLSLGISLAVFTVAIITGYAIYRHFKEKKIDYGIMQ